MWGASISRTCRSFSGQWGFWQQLSELFWSRGVVQSQWKMQPLAGSSPQCSPWWRKQFKHFKRQSFGAGNYHQFLPRFLPDPPQGKISGTGSPALSRSRYPRDDCEIEKTSLRPPKEQIFSPLPRKGWEGGFSKGGYSRKARCGYTAHAQRTSCNDFITMSYHSIYSARVKTDWLILCIDLTIMQTCTFARFSSIDSGSRYWWMTVHADEKSVYALFTFFTCDSVL